MLNVCVILYNLSTKLLIKQYIFNYNKFAEQVRTRQQTAGPDNGGPIRTTRWSMRFSYRGFRGAPEIRHPPSTAVSKSGGRWAALTG